MSSSASRRFYSHSSAQRASELNNGKLLLRTGEDYRARATAQSGLQVNSPLLRQLFIQNIKVQVNLGPPSTGGTAYRWFGQR